MLKSREMEALFVTSDKSMTTSRTEEQLEQTKCEWVSLASSYTVFAFGSFTSEIKEASSIRLIFLYIVANEMELNFLSKDSYNASTLRWPLEKRTFAISNLCGVAFRLRSRNMVV